MWECACYKCVLWVCNGCATGMRHVESVQCMLGVRVQCVWCVCVTRAMCEQWVCNGRAMDVQWMCNGCAMGVQGTECMQCVVEVWGDVCHVCHTCHVHSGCAMGV